MKEVLDKSNKILKKKFSIPALEGEIYIDNYVCSLKAKILLSGKFHLTNKRVLFRSFFNDRTLFGKGTKIIIPLTTISMMDKKCYGNMKIFPNSIQIKTLEGSEYFFTSFNYSSRNTVFKLIKQLIKEINLNDPY